MQTPNQSIDEEQSQLTSFFTWEGEFKQDHSPVVYKRMNRNSRYVVGLSLLYTIETRLQNCHATAKLQKRDRKMTKTRPQNCKNARAKLHKRMHQLFCLLLCLFELQ